MTAADRSAPPGWVRPATEYGPLVLFFVTYKLAGLLWATGVFMGAVVVALLAAWRTERRLPPMTLFTGVVVLVFGGLTLATKDPTFIKMKPTIVSGLIGIALVGGALAGRPLLKPLLGSAMRMDDEGWRALSLRFGLLSLGLAALNEVVWRTQTEDFWVNFKLFGLTGITFVFMLTQSALLARHALPEEGSSPEV
jgi:intracellular septation protein